MPVQNTGLRSAFSPGETPFCFAPARSDGRFRVGQVVRPPFRRRYYQHVLDTFARRNWLGI